MTTPVRLTSLPSADFDFRILRLHGSTEDSLTALFHDLSAELLGFMPRLAACAINASTSLIDMTARGERLRALLDEMAGWRSSRLESCGFSPPHQMYCELSYSNAALEDPTTARHLAQSVVLYNSFHIIRWLVLRSYLKLAPGTAPIAQQLGAACLDVATDVSSCVRPTVALLDARAAPVITPWLASNMFNAAVTFAIPIFRAIESADRSRDAEESVDTLPFIPGDDLSVGSRPSDRVTAHRPFPATVYSDPRIRGYSMQILAILDALPRFKGTPIGETATDKLTAFVDQTGLRQSQTPGSGAALDAGGDTGAVPGGMSELDDSRILDEILQMDSEFWRSLREMELIPAS